ncbi:Cupredoxin [Ganoderma leucocontextum]|nr:Cupredoxin [Ganoderma leucocontextum]
MRFATSISALALASTAFAADTVIHVGNDGNGKTGLFFTPSSVTANVNDTVTFVFDTPSTNHTVAQSSFAKPCEPVAGGFASGYLPGVSGSSAANFTLTVSDTSKPIWFYCAQPTKTHCIAGMVGAINPPASGATNDLSAFVALATVASSIVQPTPALTGIGAFATASATAPVVSSTGTGSSSGSGTSTAQATATSNAAPAGVKGVSGGFVAAVAAAFGVALL